MIFNSKYFKEIEEEEKYLTTLFKQGNLMIYMRYGKVAEFYSKKIEDLKEVIGQSNNNPFLESIYNTLISTLDQVNYITEESKKGNTVDVQPLFSLFFTNAG